CRRLIESQSPARVERPSQPDMPRLSPPPSSFGGFCPRSHDLGFFLSALLVRRLRVDVVDITHLCAGTQKQRSLVRPPPYIRLLFFRMRAIFLFHLFRASASIRYTFIG